ncbi:hypothetical protein DACRYDRAFT_116231 [Dacryopinax primogenitus]|uniref:Phorbol-ester/DAG-type domain-containing protein n=1 Tax=Dacryopinax primogenitus (strain DJM 731) TaxID=1858805 RepID=M5G7F4_DACPD|nr:uncharacterized protein DACRYDRAFT_116231 [Dacryopinax primogenitus]EJU01782.1 hypothetical protein DACRYDRAFT_116231 [Dacryopinax primogenitus]
MSSKEPSPFLTVSAPPNNSGLLRVDTSPSGLTTIELDTPTKSSAGSSRALSLAIPSLRSSIGSKDSPSPFSPVQQVESRNVNAPLSRLRVEYRKLLRHVLQRLQDRAKPPDIFSFLQTSSSNVPRSQSETSSLRGFVSVASGLGGEGVPYASEDEEAASKPGKRREDTDDTCDRMIELREVLLGAELRGLHILSSGTTDEDPGSGNRTSGLPFGRRRRSTIGNSNRPSAGSVNKGKSDDGLQLFHQCVSLLGELISNDCRFTVTHFRPGRPPNTLQSLCIDVCQCLLVSQKGAASAKGAYEVGLAMMPAFESFPESMRGRLCGFFEGVICGCLSDLKLVLSPKKKPVIGDPFEDRPTFTFNTPQISIQVESANESDGESRGPGGILLWSTATTAEKNVVSTYAPDQPMRVYYLSALISPLLASVLENMDMTLPTSDNEGYWVRRLFRTLVDLKPDVYQDVFEIVAYNSGQARRAALSVLATFWPKALGHNVVCLPLPVWQPAQDQSSRLLRGIQEPSDHPYAHEFLPWRFPPPPKRMTGNSMTNMSEFAQQATQKLSQIPCRACMKPVHDFGLLCPFCNSAVHFTCYDPPEGSTITEYTTSSGVQRLAIMRFSHILPARRTDPEEPLSIAGHILRWVNMFTLSLCFVCQEPIWGVARQGLMCSGCHQCAHFECIHNSEDRVTPECGKIVLSEATYSIDWSLLRRSFVNYYRPIVLTEQQLHTHSHETVSIILCLLWLQLQLMNNGIAAASVTINQAVPTTRAARTNGVDEFELQYLVRLCDAILQNNTLQKSDVMMDYGRMDGAGPGPRMLLFDPSFLYYMTSLIKGPKGKREDLSGSLLRPEILTPTIEEEEGQPYEVTELAYAYDVLAQKLLIDMDFIVQHTLRYLHRLGLLERLDLAGDLLDGTAPAQQLCRFPLPLAVDLSNNVETLFSAVEGCLTDVDLMVNEAGFLLLKRCCPNGLMSTYAVERLVRAVLQWIMREDRNLLTVASDYVSQKKPAPGIRTALDTQPWPTATAFKSPAIVQGGTMSGGNEYLAFRRGLLEKYGIPWLLRAHTLDTAEYVKILHEHCLATAAEETESSRLMDALFLSTENKQATPKIDVAFADATLRAFLKLCQSSVVFTAFDELFMFWLDEISNHGTDLPMVVRTLPRLFQAEPENARRRTVMGDDPLDQEPSLSDLIDPWRSVTSVASEGVEGIARSLRWVLLLAQSGVNIPELTFKQIAAFARDFQAPLDVQLYLVHAIFASIWIRSLRRRNLAVLIETLLELNEAALISSIKHKSSDLVEAPFIRLSLATLLALFGVDREKIVNSGLVRHEEHEVLTSRRRAGGRIHGPPEPLSVSDAFVALLLRLSRLGSETTASYVMNFLGLLLTEATLVSQSDLDLFININSESIYRILWHSFTWNSAHMPDLRLKCLLKLHTVDDLSFEALLDEVFDLNQPWHTRLDSAGTLFSLILELNNCDPVQLKPHLRRRLSGLYRRFFRLVWEDDQELVRSTIETLAENLLPSHWAFIQSSWDNYLENCDDARKEQFVGFLLRLHPCFPTWSMVSIRCIVDALGNDRSMYEDPSSIYDNIIDVTETSDASSNPRTQAMLVSLALNFIAHGVTVDPVDLLKIKVFLARQVGFPQAILRIAADGTCHVALGPVFVPNPAEQGLSCLAAAKCVLDASTKANASPSMLGVNITSDPAISCLVGTLLVDLVLDAVRKASDFRTMSHLALRAWLECLIIVILKYDMRSPVLRNFDTDLRAAVARTTEIFSMDTPYDNRQLALTVNQCYLRKFSGDAAAILTRQINAVADMLGSLDFNTEDILVAQGKVFLSSTFNRFPNNGLFVLLFKNGDASDSLLKALMVTLKDCSKDGIDGLQFALRDVIEKAFTRTSHTDFNFIVRNLHRYVDKVYIQGWPPDLITEMGFFLSNISRHTADWPSEDFDGDPAISVVTILAERDPSNSRELMVHTEVYLRWALLRFDVQTPTLRRLLKAAELVASQPSKGPPPTKNDPYLAVAVVESLRDTMMMKPRPTLLTVHSMLETARSISIEGPPLSFSVPDRLAADCLIYIQSFHTTAATGLGTTVGIFSYDLAFSVCVEASTIFLLGLQSQRDALRTAFGAGAGQAMVSRAGQGLRMWAFFALAALSFSTERPELQTELRRSLAQHVTDYCFTFATMMNELHESLREDRNDLNDLSYAHASLILWLLLTQSSDVGGLQEATLWYGIWPALEQVIIKSHGLGGGTLHIAAQQLSDVFVDIVMFLLRSNSPLALKHAATFTGLLSEMKEVNGRAQSKIVKCLQSLSQPPCRANPGELLFEARSTLLANEKVTSAFMSEYLRNTVSRNPRTGRPA